MLVAAGAAFGVWQAGYFNSSSGKFGARSVLEFEFLTESGKTFFPSISPDKQFIAYIISDKDLYSIVLQNIETGSITQVVSPKKYEIRSPQFSKDGNYLYYAARDGGQESTVYKTPIFGGTSQKIATNVNQNFSISFDGEWLAYFRYHPQTDSRYLLVCRKDGSGERIVSEGGKKLDFRVWGVAPAWSPDGQKIAASVFNRVKDEKPDTYFVEVDVRDGSIKKLNAPDWKIAFQAYWLADSAGFVALVQEKPDMPLQLWHLDYPSGAAVPITNDNNNYTEFRLAPDSEFIIATVNQHLSNLQLIPVKNPEQVIKLTDSTTIKRGFMGLDWTPDGKNLIYVQIEGLMAGNLWKMNIETRRTTQLTFDQGAWNQFPDVAPDGKSVFFSSDRTGIRHIWQVDIDGTNLQQISDGSGEEFPVISNDGNRLFYQEAKHLWRKNLNGGKPVKLMENAAPIAVSYDIGYIIASYYDKNEINENQWKQVLLSLEADGKAEIMDFLPAGQNASRWRNDNLGIYLLSSGETVTNIEFYSLADKSINSITNFESQQISNLSLSPDGKTFAVGRGEKINNVLKIKGFKNN